MLTEPGSHAAIHHASLSSSTIIEIHWSKDRWALIFLKLTGKDELPKQINIILDETGIDLDEYYSYTYRKEYKVIQGNNDCGMIMKSINFNSTDKYFSDSSDLIFSTDYVEGISMNVVSVRGERELPIEKLVASDPTGMKAPSIISIVVAIIVVLCIAIGIGVYYVSRKKFLEIIGEEKMMKKNEKRKRKVIQREDDN